jgi:hypothetical protein
VILECAHDLPVCHDLECLAFSEPSREAKKDNVSPTGRNGVDNARRAGLVSGEQYPVSPDAVDEHRRVVLQESDELAPGKAGNASAFLYHKPTIEFDGFIAEEILAGVASGLILIMAIGL